MVGTHSPLCFRFVLFEMSCFRDSLPLLLARALLSMKYTATQRRSSMTVSESGLPLMAIGFHRR